MRRLIALMAVVALMATLGPSSVTATPGSMEGQVDTLYIALGDSAAWGDGASVPDHTGYVPRLSGYFQGASHGGADELVNLSVRGATTATLLTGQMPAALAKIADPTTDTRVVTISIGGNDLLGLVNDPSDPCLVDPYSPACQLLFQAALLGVATNMPQILLALQTALAADPGNEKVFVLLYYNPFSGTGLPLDAAIAQGMLGTDRTIDCTANATNLAYVGLNDLLACASAYFGVLAVDVYPLFEGRALELTHIAEGFNIHPNDEGYAVIAKAHRERDRTG